LKKKNIFAKDLFSKKYKPRIVEPRKVAIKEKKD